jgi:hypothetical protein
VPLRIQILIAVSTPGSCGITGAVYTSGYLLFRPSAHVICPCPLEPGKLAPEVPLGAIGLSIRYFLAKIRPARVVISQGARVTWRQAFQALLQFGSRPSRRLVGAG